MSRIALFAILITLILALAGCQSETGLRALSAPELEVMDDLDSPDGDTYIVVHVTLPEVSEGDDEDLEEETPAPGPGEVECPERVLYNTNYFGQGQVEVAGYPVVTTSSPNAVQISPGDPVYTVFTVTATCGPIRWQGGDMYMAPSGNMGSWNEPFYGYNQAPMYIEDLGLGEVMEVRSYQVSHVAEGQLFWPARENDWSPDNDFLGRDLVEGESVTYRFTFTATDIVPQGETLLVGLTMGVWTDMTTGTEIPFDHNFYNPTTVMVVE
jgi:hypothetical protein